MIEKLSCLNGNLIKNGITTLLHKWVLPGVVCLLLVSGNVVQAQLPFAPASFGPDIRFKADILLVLAHPDDETIVSGYLARAILEGHKRIAVVLITTGNRGDNSYGYEAGDALGQIRIQELRRALDVLGITDFWTLGQQDTPSQNVLWSLGNWNHGQVLQNLVRLVRLTRPEVILTLLPAYVAGENHGDHQAAGVVATEAFDLAGDLTVFPEQVSPPRNFQGASSLTDGLRPWQPKKIYYFTDAYESFNEYWHDKQIFSPFRKNFLSGAGPEYSTSEISPSKHVSYGKIAAEEQSIFLTQGGKIGQEALAKGDVSGFEFPVHFIFGKSVVKVKPTSDIFEGILPGAAPFIRVPGYQQPPIKEELEFSIGDPWAFYENFWKAHDVERLSQLLPIPEVALNKGETLHVPLLIRNNTETAKEVSLTTIKPMGWSEIQDSSRYRIGPHDILFTQAVLVAPTSLGTDWQEIIWKAVANGQPAGTVKIRVYLGKGGMPQ